MLLSASMHAARRRAENLHASSGYIAPEKMVEHWFNAANLAFSDEQKQKWSAFAMEGKTGELGEAWDTKAFFGDPDPHADSRVKKGFLQRMRETEGYQNNPEATCQALAQVLQLMETDQKFRTTVFQRVHEYEAARTCQDRIVLVFFDLQTMRKEHLAAKEDWPAAERVQLAKQTFAIFYARNVLLPQRIKEIREEGELIDEVEIELGLLQDFDDYLPQKVGGFRYEKLSGSTPERAAQAQESLQYAFESDELMAHYARFEPLRLLLDESGRKSLDQEKGKYEAQRIKLKQQLHTLEDETSIEDMLDPGYLKKNQQLRTQIARIDKDLLIAQGKLLCLLLPDAFKA